MSEIKSIDQLEKEITELIETQKQDFSLEQNEKIKPKINEIKKQLDQILDQCYFLNQIQWALEIGKNEKGKAMYLKGKLMDILPEYIKQAEEALSKSLKLNPLNTDCWNTLGHILWKKKDYEGAYKCFEGSNEQCGRNKTALRSISIILRQLGQDQVRQQNVSKSIDIAKEALNLDLNDGESWYVLGNAYMSNFFVNMKTISELQLALKAYNQAEKHLKEEKNPDMHYNRATIYNYLEDYELAMNEYKKAGEMDKEFQIEQIVKAIYQKVENMQTLIANKGKIKQKQLTMMVKNIPSIKTPGQGEQYKDYQIASLSELVEGRNKNKIASCKVTNIITKMNDVPAIFVVVDYKSEFGALSIYNTNVKIYERIGFQTEIYVADPLVKVIKFTSKDEPQQELSYKCIQIFEIQSLWADSQKIVDTFSPSTVVNETFSVAHPHAQVQEEEKKKC